MKRKLHCVSSPFLPAISMASLCAVGVWLATVLSSTQVQAESRFDSRRVGPVTMLWGDVSVFGQGELTAKVNDVSATDDLNENTSVGIYGAIGFPVSRHLHLGGVVGFVPSLSFSGSNGGTFGSDGNFDILELEASAFADWLFFRPAKSIEFFLQARGG